MHACASSSNFFQDLHGQDDILGQDDIKGQDDILRSRRHLKVCFNFYNSSKSHLLNITAFLGTENIDI